MITEDYVPFETAKLLKDLGIAREHKFIVVYDYFNAGFKFREKYSLVMQNSKCEIIGNIYDNPELTTSKER